MNSRLAARDVDGGAYCCTGKAHHLARRLRAELEVDGYACGPPSACATLRPRKRFLSFLGGFTCRPLGFLVV